MLRITVELVPFGNEVNRKMIGQVLIVNDGTGDMTTGFYRALVQEDDDPERRTKKIRINNFERSRGAVALLKEVLDAYLC